MRNVEILKQNLNSPMPVEEQTAIIYAGTKNLLKNVPVNKVKEFETAYLDYLRTKHADTMAELKSGKYTDEAQATMKAAAEEGSKQFAS